MMAGNTNGTPTPVIWVKVVWFVAAPWLVEGPEGRPSPADACFPPDLLIISSPAIMMRKPDIISRQNLIRQYVTSFYLGLLFHVYCMLHRGPTAEGA